MTDGGCGATRVPAMDDVGGFFLPQLTQLEPGIPHPPLRHPVLNDATLSAAITIEQRQNKLRMVVETLRDDEGSRWSEAELPVNPPRPPFQRIVVTTSLFFFGSIAHAAQLATNSGLAS